MKRKDVLRKMLDKNGCEKAQVSHLSKNCFYIGEPRKEFSTKDFDKYSQFLYTYKEALELFKD